MKITSIKTTTLLMLFFATIAISCSSDDTPLPISQNNTTTNTTTITHSNYIPLTVGDTWSYNVALSGLQTATNTEDITVDGTLMINTYEYADLSASAGSIGIMSQLFDENYFRSQDGAYYINGEFELPIGQMGGTDITITLNDEKLIDENQNPGTIIGQVTGSEVQNIGGFDLTISYTLKTIQRETISSHTVNSETFNNVIKSDIIVSASVSTPIDILGTIISVPILAAQDIYTINNYYAENIGLIDSNAIFTYTIEDLSSFNITLPIPNTGTLTTLQDITTYTVAE